MTHTRDAPMVVEDHDRKAYGSPRLMTYGNVTALTQARVGSSRTKGKNKGKGKGRGGAGS